MLAAPACPNPLRGKDLRRQQTTLKKQIEVKFLLCHALDIARLACVEDFLALYNFRPLVAV